MAGMKCTNPACRLCADTTYERASDCPSYIKAQERIEAEMLAQQKAVEDHVAVQELLERASVVCASLAIKAPTPRHIMQIALLLQLRDMEKKK